MLLYIIRVYAYARSLFGRVILYTCVPKSGELWTIELKNVCFAKEAAADDAIIPLHQTPNVFLCCVLLLFGQHNHVIYGRSPPSSRRISPLGVNARFL